MNKTSHKPLLLAAFVAMTGVASVALAQTPAKTPPQPASSGYALDSERTVVKSGFGTCVRSGFWTPAHAIVECDPDLVPKPAAPVPKPAAAPVAPPKPVAPAPAPAAKPAAKPAAVAPVTEKVTLAADVLFDFDKAVVKPEGQKKLDDLVGKMKAINLEVIIAIGHTDSIGSDAYNQKLSMRRATAVKSYMVSKGIEANRIYTEGKGEKQPVASNTTKDGRAKNRRVDVEVVGTRTVNK